jgi:hypothetical protein
MPREKCVNLKEMTLSSSLKAIYNSKKLQGRLAMGRYPGEALKQG